MSPPDRDDGPVRAADLAEAAALLTRLPVPRVARPRGARAAWAWPLAGLIPGGAGALAAALALFWGLPAALAAGLALAAMVAATGALHEDGLADTADGLWGGWDRARRLEIMRDSRTGTYGVIALILSLGLRWTALAVVLASAGPWVLLPVAVLSRAPMPVLMRALPQARDDGLSRATGRPPAAAVWIALGLALLVGLFAFGGAVVPLLVCAALTTLALGLAARARIGGQTGDILGAAQQLAEIAILLALAA